MLSDEKSLRQRAELSTLDDEQIAITDEILEEHKEANNTQSEKNKKLFAQLNAERKLRLDSDTCYLKTFSPRTRKIPELKRAILDIAKRYRLTNCLVAFLRKQKSKLFAYKNSRRSHADKLFADVKDVTVLSTQHTYYVACLIKGALENVHINCDIITKEPLVYRNKPYIVLTPQIWRHLPHYYIAFQMEQTVSSRWLTREYENRLSRAHAVLDYSLINIKYFASHLKKLPYYVPIDFNADYHRENLPNAQKYDVLFYGDLNERRARIIDKLKTRFNVYVAREVFGDEMRDIIRNSKIVLNLHYYKNALLETTRIYEVLSLNSSVIVSECSCDASEELPLRGIVDFVDVDNVELLTERIEYWLGSEELRKERIAASRDKLNNRGSSFEFYFYRALLALDMIDFDMFYSLCGDYIHFGGERVCVSLPESVNRRTAFDKENKYGFEVFPGLRHSKAWIGCALSYKYIFKKALEQNLHEITVCEDDVYFPENFQERLAEIQGFLTDKEWDVFSGLMSDVGDVNVKEVCSLPGQRVLKVDKMISTVFNVYSQRIFETISEWNPKNRDVLKNTIDRYLENYDGLNIYVAIPYLVGHKEDLNSTIWRHSNGRYKSMIDKSVNYLNLLADEYEASWE